MSPHMLSNANLPLWLPYTYSSVRHSIILHFQSVCKIQMHFKHILSENSRKKLLSCKPAALYLKARNKVLNVASQIYLAIIRVSYLKNYSKNISHTHPHQLISFY